MRRCTRLVVALSFAVAACDLRPTEPPPDPLPEPEPPAQPPAELPVDPSRPGRVDTLSAMTFNIFHDRGNETLRIAPWEGRRDIVVSTIAEADADIVGLQEAYVWQVAWLVLQRPDYSHVGRGREADGSGESVSILFKADRFTLEESGDFWLSPTPDVPGSTGGASWGGSTIPRIVTWARVRFVDDDRQLYVYNTHLPANESGGPEARRLGVILLADRIAGRSQPDVPFILLGDFNSAEGDFPIRYLKREDAAQPPSPIDMVDTWRQVNAGSRGTRCRNDRPGPPTMHGERVDYVLVMDATWTDGVGGVRSTADGVLASTALLSASSCASDHVGVVSRFVLP